MFDWGIVPSLGLQRPVILAGGLTPENVAEAIEKVQPFAIDVNSGIELRPGLKDYDKLRVLFEEVRRADSARIG